MSIHHSNARSIVPTNAGLYRQTIEGSIKSIKYGSIIEIWKTQKNYQALLLHPLPGRKPIRCLVKKRTKFEAPNHSARCISGWKSRTSCRTLGRCATSSSSKARRPSARGSSSPESSRWPAPASRAMRRGLRCRSHGHRPRRAQRARPETTPNCQAWCERPSSFQATSRSRSVMRAEASHFSKAQDPILQRGGQGSRTLGLRRGFRFLFAASVANNI